MQRVMRNRYLLAADIVAVLLAAYAAFAFRFGWLFVDFRPEFYPFVISAVIIKIGAFFAFGMYRRYWRYAGFWDLMAIVLANATASVILSAIIVSARLLDWIPGLSRSVPPLDFLFSVAGTVGIRASFRAILETVSRRASGESVTRRRVLIVGAGDAGALVAREMEKNPQLGLVAVGFLDDDRLKSGKQIYGLPVLGRLDALVRVAEQLRVDEVAIAIPTAGGRVIRQVVERCREIGLPSRVVPGVFELLDGHLSVSRLRTVDIADLLRRPQIASRGLDRYLGGATVLVTGAGGSIGSELSRQVANEAPGRLLLLGHGENSIFEIAAELGTRFPTVSVTPIIVDIRDRQRLFRVFRAYRPTVVFHAAAHKHVPLMEDNPAEAVTNNILGTKNVVDAALAVSVPRLVMVSTDKAASPTNVMGASKRIAEQIVHRASRSEGKSYVVVRFGNVLGSRGSVVPIFRAQIERGGPVTVTDPEVRRYFMTIPEAVHLILEAGGLGGGGELFVLDMGEPVLLRDMAADMIRLSGLEESEIPIVFTGLRPGEKLNEILWEEGARVETTSNPDIRRVFEPASIADQLLDDVIGKLSEAATRDEHDRIIKLFHEAIPSASLTSRPGTVAPAPGDVIVFPRT